MKSLYLLPIALLLVISLVGCATRNDGATTNGTTGTNNNMPANKTEENRMHDTTTTVPNGTTGTHETTGINGTTGTTGTKHNLSLSEDAAKKITAINEVERATVILSDHNAYVGVTLKNKANESAELERKITDEVKATDKSIKNVHISVNPDFTKHFEEYGAKIRAGEPVEGFFEEFSDVVHRAFPTATK